ncbi:hypothetical protein GCM10023156_62170 [Novipirellula rosea]|uniref:Secreted protein n=1 Tax=Novipirellula rosea TaxID=1031540 RepID=A0ABP8NR99_9BACT
MLSITKKLVPALAIAAAFSLGLGSQAQAQHGHGFSSGHAHGGFNGGHSYSGSVHLHHTPSYSAHYPSQSYYTPQYLPTYHNTTHLDYHAPQATQHGNHFHYQQGHYDVHQSGHWHN